MKRIIRNLAEICLLLGIFWGLFKLKKESEKELIKQKELSDKHLSLYLLMNEWVQVKQRGKKVSDYLKSLGYSKVAIYGMNYVGETLFKELQGSEVEVMYGIDKDADSIYADCEVITPDNEFNNIDAIIVTPIFYFMSIEKTLKTKTDVPIISIEDIIYDM